MTFAAEAALLLAASTAIGLVGFRLLLPSTFKTVVGSLQRLLPWGVRPTIPRANPGNGRPPLSGPSEPRAPLCKQCGERPWNGGRLLFCESCEDVHLDIAAATRGDS